MPQISGKFLKQMPVVMGETEKGVWYRSTFQIMAGEEFPRMVAFSLFGQDRVTMVQGINPGDTVVVDYQPESREVGDRVFTDLKCLRVSIVTKYVPPSPAEAQTMVASGQSVPPAAQQAAFPPQQGIPAQMPAGPNSGIFN